MRTFYVLLLFIFCLVLCDKCTAQLGLFKYSTFYGGVGLNNSINEESTYSIQNNQLSETSIDNKFNYRISFGWRRLARLNFESKGQKYFDGSETKWGVFRSSLMNGLEYNFSHERIRDRGIEFVNSDYWLRYLASFYQIKFQASNLEGIDLKYEQIDLRLKKDIKNWRLSVGAIYRFHNAYGVNPFNRDFNSDDGFQNIAEQMGYYNEFYFIDNNNNNHLDRTEQSFFRWLYDENVIAETTNEFFKYHYSGIVNTYNKNQIEILGTQQTLSAIVGANWYKYNNTYHTLFWANFIPYNKPLTEYGYENGIDYELGALIQKELTKNMAFYLEFVYLTYFKRENFNIKTGLNYIIK